MDPLTTLREIHSIPQLFEENEFGNIMKALLSIPAGQDKVERVFSSLKYIYSKNRRSLSEDKLWPSLRKNRWNYSNAWERFLSVWNLSQAVFRESLPHLI